MKTKYFKLHWRGDSNPEIVCGLDIADAMNRAGYGHGALGALDYFESISEMAALTEDIIKKTNASN